MGRAHVPVKTLPSAAVNDPVKNRSVLARRGQLPPAAQKRGADGSPNRESSGFDLVDFRPSTPSEGIDGSVTGQGHLCKLTIALSVPQALRFELSPVAV